VISFDPRHGSTCHPAHRALGELVLEASRRIPAPPRIFLIETLAERLEDGESIRLSRFAPEDRRVLSFEGETAHAQDPGRTAWSYLIADARIHASQFSERSVADLAAVPAEEQEVRLLPAVVLEPGADYASPCPPSTSITSPVMKEGPEQRKSTVFATSAGTPSR
jgi:hypothetical protein